MWLADAPSAKVSQQQYNGVFAGLYTADLFLWREMLRDWQGMKQKTKQAGSVCAAWAPALDNFLVWHLKANHVMEQD